MMEIRNSTFAFVLSTAILSAPVASAGLFVNNFLASPAVAQSAISIVVNGIAITNFDIQQKIAFLKLSKRTGNLASIARKELIDDTLRRSAIQRFKLDPTPQQIDEALNNFIQLNHVTAEQFTELLNQNGISIDYFKTYIATQIGWASLLRMRYRAEHGPISQQEAVQKMIKNGGIKPSINEYTMRRIIFVTPQNQRANLLEKRLNEAKKFRAQFKGCASLNQQAQQYLDVTIRALPKTLEPELSPDWASSIRAAGSGRMTEPRQTPLGVEAIAVCSVEPVSDDHVARLAFSLKDLRAEPTPQQLDALNDKYLKELRDTAQIRNL